MLAGGKVGIVFFLAKLGYKVVALDISLIGIKELLGQAQKQKLVIKTEVKDVYTIKNFNAFDIILS